MGGKTENLCFLIFHFSLYYERTGIRKYLKGVNNFRKMWDGIKSKIFSILKKELNCLRGWRFVKLLNFSWKFPQSSHPSFRTWKKINSTEIVTDEIIPQIYQLSHIYEKFTLRFSLKNLQSKYTRSIKFLMLQIFSKGCERDVKFYFYAKWFHDSQRTKKKVLLALHYTRTSCSYPSILSNGNFLISFNVLRM